MLSPKKDTSHKVMLDALLGSLRSVRLRPPRQREAFQQRRWLVCQ